MLLDAGKSSLLVIDIQDRLLPAMVAADIVVAKTTVLMTTSRTLGLPVTVSEQYPKGLGRTVPSLLDNDASVFEKISFSCWRDEAMRKHFIQLHEHGRPQVVITGIEAHVCALQTAIDLSQAGFAVFAVTDAMSSRKQASAELAFQRMAHAGVELINTEMAVFELLGEAGTPQFKALSALIK